MDSRTEDIRIVKSKLKKAVKTLMYYASEDEFVEAIAEAKEKNVLPKEYKPKKIIAFTSYGVKIYGARININKEDCIINLKTSGNNKLIKIMLNKIYYLTSEPTEEGKTILLGKIKYFIFEPTKEEKKLAEEMQGCLQRIWEAWKE